MLQNNDSICVQNLRIEYFFYFYVIMTNEKKYTHLATFYGIRCYYNIETQEIQGTTWLNDKLIDLRLFVERIFPFGDGFYINIVKPL